jgi:L-fuconolactonase
MVSGMATPDIPAVTTPRRAPALEVIDAQFHLRGEVDAAVAAMEAVGVERAVVDIWPAETRLLPHGVTRYEYGFVEEARRRFPGRFAYVARVDPDDPELDGVVADIAATAGAVCLRIFGVERFEAGADTPTLAAADRHRVPVMVYAAGHHEAVLRYVRAFPSLQFVIDHCGMAVNEVSQPGGPARPASEHIDALLPYAAHSNVAIKWSHAPRLSQEEFPYRDVGEQLARAIDAFGVERLLWGSDFTVTRDHHTYAESLFAVRANDLLSDTDKEWVLGRSLRRVLGWPA